MKVVHQKHARKITDNKKWAGSREAEAESKHHHHYTQKETKKRQSRGFPPWLERGEEV